MVTLFTVFTGGLKVLSIGLKLLTDEAKVFTGGLKLLEVEMNGFEGGIKVLEEGVITVVLEEAGTAIGSLKDLLT